jgi:predicted DNA-binding helix-hairpin-helix protein
VERILRERTHHRLREADLRRIRVAWSKAKFFVVTADFMPGSRVLSEADFVSNRVAQPIQRSLFD